MANGLPPGVADIPANRAFFKKMGLEVKTNIEKETEAGAKFGEKMVAPGSLGRLGENADLRTAITGAREMAGGLTGPEMQAQRDQASQNINTNTEQARRRLAAAQARSGVRGATAGAQQASILGQGVQAQQGLERDLLLGNREAKSAGISQLANIAGEVGQFDLSQAAREKFVPLSTGLAFAGLGATERGSIRASNAAAASARGGGGGTSFICTLLRKLGMMTKKESAYMLGFMITSLAKVSRFMYFYFKNMKPVVDSLELNNIEASRLKQRSVNNIIALDSIGKNKEAINEYIKVTCEIAAQKGLDIPSNIYTRNRIVNAYYLAKIFTLKNTWVWIFNFVKDKGYRSISYRTETLKEA